MDKARYAAAGVDIDAGNRMVELIKPLVRGTARPGADAEIGGFGGLFDLKAAGFSDPILVAATDGVGTKVKIAIETGRHDTIGIDLVAMSVNDLVVQGAEPLFFLDYFACGKLDPAVGGGGGRRRCRSLPGSAVRADRRRDRGNAGPLPARRIRSRRLCGRRCRTRRSASADRYCGRRCRHRPCLVGRAFERLFAGAQGRCRCRARLDAPAPFEPSRTLGEALLTPTRLYVQSCLAAIRGTKAVKALAHITGGGFVDNIPRVLPPGFSVAVDLDRVPVLPVFKWLAGAGKIDAMEMLRTFNCGIGMIAVLDAGGADAASAQFAAKGDTVVRLGEVVKQGGEPQSRIPRAARSCRVTGWPNNAPRDCASPSSFPAAAPTWSR